ncbi:response regulator transcription factor [Rothia sp. ND6WE1A]|uniref:response regulator n=1 Tax=Rothia sp. ND6WE1A TaxID=1848190 RepID=UPI00082A34FD|nr:response regulator transcription factor [Rothia sp. ND6WE1A]
MIKVLIADDEAIMREIINDYLAHEKNISVVGEARDGQSAIVQARGLRPDVILMDMQMPGIDGVEATSIIHQELPDVRILGLSTFATDRYVVNLLHAGASGYLVKSSSPEQITSAIQTVMSGGSVLSPEVTRHVVHTLKETGPSIEEDSSPYKDLLTDKELEVIKLLAQGLNNKEMAEQLFISESTVKARFVKIMEKMQVRDRVQILIKAIEHHIVDVGKL